MESTSVVRMDPVVQGQRRSRVVKLFLLLLFLTVVVRLVQIQVFESSRYQKVARGQYEKREVLRAARGSIIDRNGKILVSSTMEMAYHVDPVAVHDTLKMKLARRFAGVFHRPTDGYFGKITDRSDRFVLLEDNVTPSLARQIEAKKFFGLIETAVPKRMYHYDHVALQLTGVIDAVDHRGLSGLELQFDRYLQGTNGFVTLQRDGISRVYPTADYPRVEPVRGHDLELTIDIEFQAIAEEELARGIERSGAASGLVVIVEPTTGEVLAMANWPTFNPNAGGARDPEMLRNRVVADMFEPGSIFKVVTAAAALETGTIKPQDKVFGENGSWVVPGSRGRKIEDVHPFGLITFQEAVEKSSNIVMAKVAAKVGEGKLFDMARKFGFGQETGIDLPAETGGGLKKVPEWSSQTVYSVGYGYEVSVSALQVVMAYAAIANNGLLLRPYVMKDIVGPDGEKLRVADRSVLRQVVSPETANTLTRFFEGVVERGSGTQAKVPGLRIAGKTGTARRADRGKGYEKGRYTASFVGYFPAEAPRIVCLVRLDEPKKGSYYGGEVSAPIFRGVVQRINPLLNRARKPSSAVMAEAVQPVVPDVLMLKVEEAQTALQELGLRVRKIGKGNIVIEQSPQSGLRTQRGSVVTLQTEPAAVPQGFAQVPDVRGYSLRRAIARLRLQKLDVALSGSGRVVEQVPAPGTQILIGSTVNLRCAPKSTPLAGIYE